VPAGIRRASLPVLVGIGKQIGRTKHECRRRLQSTDEVLVYTGQFCSRAFKTPDHIRGVVVHGENKPYTVVNYEE